jgi:hypothetical protein
MDTSTPIIINGFTGDPDGVDLEECYFQETAPGSGEFLLFIQNSEPPTQIPTTPKTVTNGVPFTFEFQKLTWMAAFVYLDSIGLGAGVWSAQLTGNAEHDPSFTGDDPETGTFQAQAGLGTGDELEASASASA